MKNNEIPKYKYESKDVGFEFEELDKLFETGKKGGFISNAEQWLTTYNPSLLSFVNGNTLLRLKSIARQYVDQICYNNYCNITDQILVDRSLYYIRQYAKNEWDEKVVGGKKDLEDNPNKMTFVLIDQKTGSMAERLAVTLMHQKNTIIVGTNSAGCVIGDSLTTPISLPYSGMQVSVSGSLCLYNNQQVCQEGIGITPDLWSQNPVLDVMKMLGYEEK